MAVNRLCDETLIPGVMQDCHGEYFQYYRDIDGSLTPVPVTIPPLLPRTLAALEPVTVESVGNPGTTFRSLRCFQTREG